MQQPPRERTSRARRVNSALSGMPVATTPVYVSAALRQRWPQFPSVRRSFAFRRTFLLLCLCGLLLGFCYVLLYPLLVDALPGSASTQALGRAFPWLVDLFWTRRVPFLVALLARVPWFDLRNHSPAAAAHLALLVLALAAGFLWLAARVCGRATRERVRPERMRLLLGLICFFALLSGTLMVLLPGGVSQDTLLSGLYGRIVVFYHANPYVAGPTLLVHDPVYRALPSGTFVSPLTGPLWSDLAVPIAWLAQGNPAFTLLDFRIAGLLFHLLNTCLLWTVLTRLKPEVRLMGTLLYAWNPVVLLLGVGEMHTELVVIFFLLLGAFCLQRRALLASWICVLLAALIYPFCLLLLPLFLKVLLKETRAMSRGERAFWWCKLLLFSLLAFGLAYIPYWPGLGIGGIALHLSQSLWQSTAQNSLLTALGNLPFATWPPVAWLLIPQHWMLLPALLVGGLLLLGIWIIDNLELALLFGSWIFLALVVLLPVGSPWLVLLPLALALASSSRRTALLAHLLTCGALVAYGLALAASRWSGQALVTVGLPVLFWGWTLFFLSTWRMTHHESTEPAPPARKRRGLSRPSWPSRPAAWPSSRPGARKW